MQGVPSVTLQDARGFGSVWRHRGVAIPMQDVHLEFAKDFANVVLSNFVQQAQATQRKAAAEAAKPKVILAE